MQVINKYATLRHQSAEHALCVLKIELNCYGNARPAEAKKAVQTWGGLKKFSDRAELQHLEPCKADGQDILLRNATCAGCRGS